jgi:AAA+ superfamily predicted ATPase
MVCGRDPRPFSYDVNRFFVGPPGVGKTLTAELGAKAASRPLYKVGASDIGLHPEEAERNFSRLFRLASRWQAVILM